MPQIIKKVKKTKNQYLHESGFWIRDYTNPESTPIDINNYYSTEDLSIIAENEAFNSVKYGAKIGDEQLTFDKVMIVSDGFDFSKKQDELLNLPRDVAIFSVNKSLLLYNHSKKRPINFYIANNPYDDCMSFLPVKTSYYPACLLSYRTNAKFVQAYKSKIKYFYEPTPENHLMQRRDLVCFDDYRNPICAAISLAYHFRVSKLMLFCCDKSFSDKRDASVQLKNGLYTYEKNLLADAVINAHLSWMMLQDVKVANYSKGKEYNNSTYIQNESEMLDFFKMELK